MIYAVTHAEKEKGINPGLTPKGKADIKALAAKLPGSLKNVIIGTGKRFNDVFKALGLHKMETKKWSSLLGSADSGTKTETGMDVILADGVLVPIGNYIGIIGTPGINLWAWLKSLPAETLLCTGREFVGALINNAEAGQIYIIDTDVPSVLKYGEVPATAATPTVAAAPVTATPAAAAHVTPAIKAEGGKKKVSREKEFSATSIVCMLIALGCVVVLAFCVMSMRRPTTFTPEISTQGVLAPDYSSLRGLVVKNGTGRVQSFYATQPGGIKIPLGILGKGEEAFLPCSNNLISLFFVAVDPNSFQPIPDSEPIHVVQNFTPGSVREVKRVTL